MSESNAIELIPILIERESLLNARGGAEHDGELFEEVLSLETGILSACRLPPAEPYLTILRRLYSEPESVNNILAELRGYGRLFARERDIDPVERLSRAAQAGADPDEILPRLGVSTHVYTIWVYERLCSQQIAPQAALTAMYVAEENLHAVGELWGRYRELSEKVPMLATFLAEDTY